MESLIALASSESHSVDADKAEPDNRGTLVHLSGQDARGCAEIKDSRFAQVACQSGVIRIRSDVEVYQWVEHSETKEEKDRVGGGTTKRTIYTYKQEWSRTRHDSSNFKQRQGHDNHFPVDGLNLGTETATCSRVEYGQGFLLNTGLAEQMDAFENAAKKQQNPFALGDSLSFQRYAFNKQDGYYMYSTSHGQGQQTIGDTRVRIEYVPDGPATVMALQAKEVEQGRDNFLPYRLVSRGICGINEDELKSRLLTQGAMDRDELAQEEECHLCGPLDCLCCCCLCACNIVNRVVMNIGLPEIYHVFTGTQTTKECLKIIANRSYLVGLCMRLGGWLMMAIGLHSIFQPLFVVIDIIPFFGPWLSDNISVIIGFLCAVITLAVSSVIVGLAYLVYHPKKAFIYLLLPALAIGGVLVLCERAYKP